MKKRVKYIAKPNTWFDEGTEAVCLKLYQAEGCGLFAGKVQGFLNEEICPLEYFRIVEEKDGKLYTKRNTNSKG